MAVPSWVTELAILIIFVDEGHGLEVPEWRSLEPWRCHGGKCIASLVGLTPSLL